jgi:hypothetical protein
VHVRVDALVAAATALNSAFSVLTSLLPIDSANDLNLNSLASQEAEPSRAPSFDSPIKGLLQIVNAIDRQREHAVANEVLTLADDSNSDFFTPCRGKGNSMLSGATQRQNDGTSTIGARPFLADASNDSEGVSVVVRAGPQNGEEFFEDPRKLSEGFRLRLEARGSTRPTSKLGLMQRTPAEVLNDNACCY